MKLDSRSAVLFLALASCNSESTERVWPNPSAQTSPPIGTALTFVQEEKPAELAIRANGVTMAFEPTLLVVKAGQKVHLVFENKPPGQLPHNWALVAVGTEASVAAAGLEKGQAKNYVAEGPDVLAFTPLVMPGHTAEVTFKAPPVGNYPYICTFPGHYLMMKGVLTVTP